MFFSSPFLRALRFRCNYLMLPNLRREENRYSWGFSRRLCCLRISLQYTLGVNDANEFRVLTGRRSKSIVFIGHVDVDQ